MYFIIKEMGDTKLAQIKREVYSSVVYVHIWTPYMHICKKHKKLNIQQYQKINTWA